jgi:CRP-like cAMP-binding protein
MEVDPLNPLTPLFKDAFAHLAADLGESGTAALLDSASLVDVEPGRRLITDRMPVDHLYFIVAGELRAYLEGPRRRIELGRAVAGQCLGEVSVLSGEKKATANVQAISACRLLRIHERRFVELIAQHEVIAQVLLDHFIREMAQRLRASQAASLDLETP